MTSTTTGLRETLDPKALGLASGALIGVTSDAGLDPERARRYAENCISLYLAARPSPNGSGEQVSWDDVRAECGTTNLSVFDLLSVVNSILAKRLSASMAGPVPEFGLGDDTDPPLTALKRVSEDGSLPDNVRRAAVLAASEINRLRAPALREPVASPAEGEAVTSTMVQAAMDSLFGEYTTPGNDQAWITPNWMEAKAKVRIALERAFAAAPDREAATREAVTDTEGWKLDFVRQEHQEGCLIACLAMISGKTYAEVDGMFVRDRYSDGGLNDYQVFDFLASQGFYWRHVHQYTHLGTSKARPVWPLPLETEIALCRVDAGRGGPLSHGIVVTSDGTAYDPALGMRQFSDYATVGAMTFIRRALAQQAKPQQEKI